MKITKFGHCCLLIEESGVRILTDPALFSTGHENLTNLDAVLITHEHPDHFHLEALKVILKNNPRVEIITNSSVAKLMESIPATIVAHGDKTTIKGIPIEGFGQLHAIMHPTLPRVENTGYFIANKLFYPGGPWLKLSEAIDYALELKPKTCFPVHDGVSLISNSMNRLSPQVLEPQNIKFFAPEIGVEFEI